MRSIGEVFVKVQADIDGFRRDVEQTMAGLGDRIGPATQRLDGLSDTFNRTGRTLSRNVTLPVLAMGGAILNTSGNFEQGMNKVRALTGAAGDDLDTMREQAKQLGSTTKFSATEAADAMGFLAMAGFESNQIVSAMPSVLELAAAANLDLASSADITSNILSGYGLEVEQLGAANDALVATLTNTNVDLSMLGEAFKFVGPVAKGAGVDFNEAAAAIGLLGNAGIQGGMAGTSLRGAISRLIKPTGEAADTLEALGIEALDSSGNLKPLDNIIQQLEESGATTADMMTIFGQRAGPAMMALVEQGSDALRDLTGTLEESGGTAGDIAAIQMEGFKGGMVELKSAAEGLMIAFGESGMLEAFTGFANKITEVLRNLTQTNPEILRMITIVAGLAAAFGPLLIFVAKILKSLSILLKTVAAVGKVIALVANPIGLVVVALGLLVAGVVLAYRRFETFRNIVHGVFDVVKGIVSGFVSFFQAAFRAITPIVTGVFGVIRTLVMTVFGVLRAYFEVWFAVIGAFWQALQPVVTTVFEVIKAVAIPIIDALKVAFDTVAEAIGAVISWVADLVGGWAGFFEGIEEGIEAVGEFFIDVFGGIRDFAVQVVEIVTGFVEGFVQFFISGFENIKNVAETVWNVIRTVIETVIAIATAILNAYRTVVLTIWNVIRTAAETAFNIIRSVWQAVMSAVQAAVNGAKAVITGVWTAIRAAAELAFGVVSSAWDTMTGAISTAIETAKDLILGVFTTIKDTAERIFSGIGSFVSSVFDGAVGAVKSGLNVAIGLLNGLIRAANRIPFVNIPEIRPLADGAIVRNPMLAMIGEAGSEAVIPLTRPNRAMQLMEESGLANMVRGKGGGMSAAVNIENATFVDPVDVEKMAQKVVLAEKARAFAA